MGAFATAVKTSRRLVVIWICFAFFPLYAPPGGNLSRQGKSPLNREQQAQQLKLLRNILCWPNGNLTFACTCGEATYKGRICAQTIQQAQKIQIDIWKQETPSVTVTYVIECAETTKIWLKQGNKLSPLDENRWIMPLIPGMLWTPYDILMPFLRERATYTGVKTESRSFHQWIFASKNFSIIQVSVDASLNVPSRITFFKANQPTRIIDILKLKKFNNHWLAQSISIEDLVTQTTARLEVLKVKEIMKK